MMLPKRSAVSGVRGTPASFSEKSHCAAKSRNSLTSVCWDQPANAVRDSNLSSSRRKDSSKFSMAKEYPAWLWRWGLDAIGGILAGLILLWALANAPVLGR